MQESDPKPLKELSQETFNENLDGDYPQVGPYYVMMYLINTASGHYSEDDFFERVQANNIHTVDDYVKNKLETRFNQTAPKEMSKELRNRIETINALVLELRKAINDKLPLEEIYKLLRRFESEAGIVIDKIPKLEE